MTTARPYSFRDRRPPRTAASGWIEMQATRRHGVSGANVAVSVVSPDTTMSWDAAPPSDQPAKT